MLVGFCGTDYTLMNMGRKGKLGAKLPEGCERLINGHEGVVWVPSENRFAIVLIRGETVTIRQDIQRRNLFWCWLRSGGWFVFRQKLL